MTVDDFLQSTNTKAFEFAEKIGRHPSYISKLKKKKLIPSLIEALVIFKVSEGRINIDDMIDVKQLKRHGRLKRNASVIQLIHN